MNEKEKKAKAAKDGDHLKKLQEGIRSGKIKILPAIQDEIKLLDNWVRDVLSAIAIERDCPGMAGAFVTDVSHIGDFYGTVHFTTEEYEAGVQRVAENLNISMNDIKEDGYIVNMARRLARGE